MLTIVILTLLVGIVLFNDNSTGRAANKGTAVGFLLGGILIWVYDEIMKFERWSVILTEHAIMVPASWFQKKEFLLAELDKQRTLVYNSENNLRNRFRYTFWSTNGDCVVIGKSFYGKSQVNALLEKLGLPKI